MFREGICPECKERIQIPEEREKILCMFCGKEILVRAALAAPAVQKDTLGRKEQDDLKRLYLENCRKLLENCKNPMMGFKKDIYEERFRDFCAEYADMFAAMARLYEGSADPQKTLQRMAQQLTDAASEVVEALKSKGSRTHKQLDLNFLVSIYFIPAVCCREESFAQPFTDCLVQTWNERFPNRIEKAEYAEIIRGFHQRLCYVTTAVCESLGKGRDCHELQVLRRFRDEYLLASPQGRQMVAEYYDIAPTIVKRISRRPDSRRLYEELYREYLGPCIRAVEGGDPKRCTEIYRQMVAGLKERFLYGAKAFAGERAG